MLNAWRVCWIIFCVFTVAVIGCGGPTDDAGGALEDAGSQDAATSDSGTSDSGTTDSGGFDAGELGEPVVCEELGASAGASERAEEADFYVAKYGDDANDGTSPESAFATIQKGIDALSAGETLVIGPGEYHESLAREGLGSADAATTIRAEIPGTVTLRGDIPAPDFEKLDGYDFIYVADLDPSHEVQVVNELDTLEAIEKSPSLAELEFAPGSFYQDLDAGKLYISTPDRKPVDGREYTLSVIPTHGIYLTDPVRVVIDGLNVTGFNTAAEIHHRQRTARTVWGIFLVNGQESMIRRAHVYLNARGIGTYSAADYAGDNVIEQSVARANRSRVGESQSDTGGMTLFEPQRDVVRDSTSFLNRNYGINIRGGGEDGQDEAYQSFMRRSLAWGNGQADFKIKTGYSNIHSAERCVALGTVGNTGNADHCLVGERSRDYGDDTIVLADEEQLDPHQEFADPDNYDFRLQPNSRFRGAMDDGSDRGPHPYEETVFYVSPDGDDGADGLSVDTAWATVARAAEELEPGDTLYLLPGAHAGDIDVVFSGEEDAPITIRGRGTEPAILQGSVRLGDSAHVRVERLNFRDTVELGDSTSVSFENCVFTAADIGLDAHASAGLVVSHSLFTGFGDAAIDLHEASDTHLRGNFYDNSQAVAVRTDSADAIRHADYNGYRYKSRALQVADKLCTLDADEQRLDSHSRQIVGEFDVDEGRVEVLNPQMLDAGGLLGRPFGPYRDRQRAPELRLTGEPRVHSVSATTANIEWGTSVPATTHFSWGPTEDVENEVSFEVLYSGSYSFTGLEPDTTYYFRIDSLSIPNNVDLDLEPVEVDVPVLSFTTAASDPEPQTYWVATDGDDANDGTSRDQAWRTIQHAANQVGVGDTVQVAEGTYQERVRMRATGAPDAPITFTNVPGEEVVLHGGDKILNQAFVVAAKEHLAFDGFYFDEYSPANSFAVGPDARWDSWRGGQSGQFNIYRSKNITISRMMSDGRGSTEARDVTAHEVEDLTIRNLVSTNKFGGALYLLRVDGFLLENSVIARQQIAAFLLRNEPEEQAVMRNNIFTDNLKKKADLNISIFTADRSTDGLLHENNVYFLRGSPPVEERHLFYSTTTLADAQASGLIVDPLVTDPKFAAAEELVAQGEEPHAFSPDRLVGALDVEFDFDTFMATDQTVLQRDIGLQPDEFEGGHPR